MANWWDSFTSGASKSMTDFGGKLASATIPKNVFEGAAMFVPVVGDIVRGIKAYNAFVPEQSRSNDDVLNAINQKNSNPFGSQTQSQAPAQVQLPKIQQTPVKSMQDYQQPYEQFRSAGLGGISQAQQAISGLKFQRRENPFAANNAGLQAQLGGVFGRTQGALGNQMRQMQQNLALRGIKPSAGLAQGTEMGLRAQASQQASAMQQQAMEQNYLRQQQYDMQQDAAERAFNFQQAQALAGLSGNLYNVSTQAPLQDINLLRAQVGAQYYQPQLEQQMQRGDIQLGEMRRQEQIAQATQQNRFDTAYAQSVEQRLLAGQSAAVTQELASNPETLQKMINYYNSMLGRAEYKDILQMLGPVINAAASIGGTVIGGMLGGPAGAAVGGAAGSAVGGVVSPQLKNPASGVMIANPNPIQPPQLQYSSEVQSMFPFGQTVFNPQTYYGFD